MHTFTAVIVLGLSRKSLALIRIKIIDETSHCLWQKIAKSRNNLSSQKRGGPNEIDVLAHAQWHLAALVYFALIR